MTIRPKNFCLAVLSLAFGLAPFARADQGTTAASFLKLATGPRAIAMGENFTGLADDVNAIRYNTAGLAFVQDKEVTLMYSKWFLDTSYYDIGFEWPFSASVGTFGVDIVYLDGGSFDKWVTSTSADPNAVTPDGVNYYAQIGRAH